MKNLVIVESPAKARTLSKLLGANYSLKASMGHVRDLPRSGLGVDIEKGFAPKYVVLRAKSKIVNELKKAAKDASAVYLATDPDREGEAISWHLQKVTKTNRKPYRRVTFHEITKEAIKRAFDHPRSINMQLVNAQQARRILDRLVGYKLSPLLWRKVRRGLSAGRVQSVALKIIADREREIEQFVSVEYWTIEAELAKATETATFRAMLIGLADGTKIDIHNEQEATELSDKLKQASYKVSKVSVKKATRQPAPPFITSTLQQEAWRKLHFPAKLTMSVAQELYEGLPIGDEGNVGLITYMRTDSTRVTRSAITETRAFITEKYGSQFVPSHARSFARTVKGAQEAHEAIRPTKIWREPSLLKPHLTNAQFKLYQLIWKRMVASQMSAATFDNTTVDIQARRPRSKVNYLLRASSSVNTFPGFMILYTESKDEAEEKPSPTLPPLEKGDKLELIELFPEQHFTKPPPRFTEATLIKMLEQWGIGRPSTYAPILSTIQEREYVTKTEGRFQPTELGFVVNDLLNKHFPDIVDIEFTAHMEEELDKVANENKDWVTVVQDFYIPFEQSLQSAAELMEKVKLEELTDEICPECGKPLVIKTGRYGKFLACSGYPKCKYTKSFQVKVGVKCPQCGGELVERKSKKKRTFYGCSNYPDCKFILNARPLPQPCPKCGGLLTVYRRNLAKCTKCQYRGKLGEAGEREAKRGEAPMGQAGGKKDTRKQGG
ncbi:MAG: type I DNA topoisomerase [Dehalococcoidales bacterium]|nr:type I DNA topoisomerase [Dehalococcoidales bacterium]